MPTWLCILLTVGILFAALCAVFYLFNQPGSGGDQEAATAIGCVGIAVFTIIGIVLVLAASGCFERGNP